MSRGARPQERRAILIQGPPVPRPTFPPAFAYLSKYPATAAQLRVLRALADVTARDGHPPTFDELRIHLGCRSLRSVAVHVYQLEKKGLVTFTRVARSEDNPLRRRKVIARSTAITEAGRLYLEHAPHEALYLAARVALEPGQTRAMAEATAAEAEAPASGE